MPLTVFNVLFLLCVVYQIQARSTTDQLLESLEDPKLSVKQYEENEVLREIQNLITKLNLDDSSKSEKTEKKAEEVTKEVMKKEETKPVVKKKESKQEEKKTISNDDMDLRHLLQENLNAESTISKQEEKKLVPDEEGKLKDDAGYKKKSHDGDDDDDKKKSSDDDDDKKKSSDDDDAGDKKDNDDDGDTDDKKKKSYYSDSKMELTRGFDALIDNLKSQLKQERRDELAKKELMKEKQLSRLRSFEKAKDYNSLFNRGLGESLFKRTENLLNSGELSRRIFRGLKNEEQKREEDLERKLMLLLREKNIF